MKKLLPLVAAAMLLLGACKKSTDSGTTPTTTGSTWALAGATNTVVFSYRTTASGSGASQLLNFYDAIPSGSNPKLNSLTFSFITMPTASGTYHLVTVGAAKTADQLEMAAGTSASQAYAYVNATATDITVTVSGGKIKVTVPEITLKSTTGAADAKFSAAVQEM